jgi:hypothetical protein
MRDYCVIRNNREVYVTEKRLTPAEREQIEERKRSPAARGRFAAELRRVRQPETSAHKAIMKLLQAKPEGARCLTSAELQACISYAPAHVKRQTRRMFDLNQFGDLPRDARELTDEQLYHLRPTRTTGKHVLEILRRGVWRRKFILKGIVSPWSEQVVRPFVEAAAGAPYNYGVHGTRAEVEELNRECAAFVEVMRPCVALWPRLVHWLSPRPRRAGRW